MKIQRYLGAAFMVAMITASASPAFASSVTGTVYGQKAISEFSDIQANTPIAQAIGLVTQTGLMTGEPDGNFDPGKNISVADFAMAIVKYLGLPPASGTDGYIVAAQNLGLLPNGSNPGGSMTRLAVAMALAKALKLSPLSGSLPWNDASSIPSADRGYILNLHNRGYFNGYRNGYFYPNKTMTREQVALVFARLLGL